MLKDLSQQTFDIVKSAIAKKNSSLSVKQVGTVTKVSSGVVEVAGFSEIFANEVLRFPSGVMAVATNIEYNHLGAILLGSEEGLHVGDDVYRTQHVVDTPVGNELLGRVVDALCTPLDGNGPVITKTRYEIERPAPEIMKRAPVEHPLQTGIKAIDATIPIGLGQRELIVGDRQTGKTAVAIDTIINQKDTDILAVYCAIGLRGDSVAGIINRLKVSGVLKKCVVVVANGDDTPGLQFIAPYTATAIAEWFMERGQNVVIVYDDLTRHARAYRQLSLLLKRPPGREAYPGDIFYVHSRLLERTTHLKPEHGGGSLTALPIIETQAQNMSAFIPTNLISITDGQIYLSPELFQKGQLPAVDIGKSVSRVGGKAQLKAYREVAGLLKLSYSQFEELETFSRFGTRLDDVTRGMLERGWRVREALKQKESSPYKVSEQISILYAVTQGLFDHIEIHKVAEAEMIVREYIQTHLKDVCSDIDQGEPLQDLFRSSMIEKAKEALHSAGLSVEEWF